MQVWHMLREVNEIGDKLAKMGRGQSRERTIFIVPPETMATIVDEEQRCWMEGRHLRTVTSAAEWSASHFGLTTPNV
ncbi:hypothetical protein V6N13_036085 [Hibiscus sabdariffa]|uniref:RNase H type-1 domain-containing protein n=1 Tax=Hibiscus sabdariffa TaxID=183260 RepID=A0ABR2S7P6_9ROSI